MTDNDPMLGGQDNNDSPMLGGDRRHVVTSIYDREIASIAEEVATALDMPLEDVLQDMKSLSVRFRDEPNPINSLYQYVWNQYVPAHIPGTWAHQQREVNEAMIEFRQSILEALPGWLRRLFER